MSAPLNGKRTAPPASPADQIARNVQEALREGCDDLAWDDLTEEEREGEVFLAEHYMAAHAQWLSESGFKIIPPGATPVPKTDDEAMAMVRAAKSYFDGKKRKGGLVSTVGAQKLILPKGAH